MSQHCQHVEPESLRGANAPCSELAWGAKRIVGKMLRLMSLQYKYKRSGVAPELWFANHSSGLGAHGVGWKQELHVLHGYKKRRTPFASGLEDCLEVFSICRALLVDPDVP